MKICIVCAAGGHLAEALYVLEAFADSEIFLITNNAMHMRDFSHPRIKKIYLVKMPEIDRKNIFVMALFLIPAAFKFLNIFFKERPNVLFSTGAEVTVPAFYLGKFLFRHRLIFLETITTIFDTSKTGKLVYPITDLFLVQWPELLKLYGKRAIYAGRIT